MLGDAQFELDEARKNLEEFTVLNSGEVHKFDYSYRIGILNNEVINLKNQLATFLTNQKTLDKLINIDVITPMKVNELVDKKTSPDYLYQRLKLLDLKEVSKIEKVRLIKICYLQNTINCHN